MGKADVERARRLKKAFDLYLPPARTEEERRRDAEAFMEERVEEVVAEAHEVRNARRRGEPKPYDPEQANGVQTMGQAVSHRGFEPPETVRRALRRHTHAEPDGAIPEELTRAFNAFSLELLRLSLKRFNEETSSEV